MFTRNMTRLFPSSNLQAPLHPVATGAAVAIAILAISALVNWLAAKKAERDNPPTGKFVEVKGVRLHYVEEGEGEPLVLLHGNAGMIQDFACSGLIHRAARRYRVIVFDRPGFGYSDRRGARSGLRKPKRTFFMKRLQNRYFACHRPWPFLGGLGRSSNCA